MSMTPTPDNHGVDIYAAEAIFPAPTPAPYELSPELGSAQHLTYTCPAPGRDLIPPNKLRRLGRAQLLALGAATLAVRTLPEDTLAGPGTGVFVGTGLGELGDTTAFLTSMFAKESLEPKPTHFINSVHNSLASEIAIVHRLQGENYTLTQNFISFELALAEAMLLLRAGRIDRALVCGADKLTPHLVVAGRHYGWWSAEAADVAPLAQGGGGHALPGEGAAAFVLARPGTVPGANPVARVQTVLARPASSDVDPASERAFVETVLAKTDVPLDDLDLVIAGANGAATLDTEYARVIDALAPEAAVGVYKHRCGEFFTASALGLALATQCVGAGTPPESVCIVREGHGKPMHNVLLYHLAHTGYHSACLLSAP